MPSHVVVAYLTIALVPLAAALTSVHALSARSRKPMRLWVILANIAAISVVIWAASEGPMLLDTVTRTASAAESEAANAHALASANLFYATGAMLALVLTTAWWLLRPGRPASPLSRIASGLLVASAIASLLTLWLVAEAGANAVWTT